jgi:hypothetical protein
LISTHKTKLGSAALLARFRLARCSSNKTFRTGSTLQTRLA